ncbi:MAG: 50S ribosomal protein L1 [Candidatus Poribacteria bacterium]|nr:50S ribosomal protein L1 [Candidatus Poribacteria bacterium]
MSKRYRNERAKIDRTKLYNLTEAIETVKGCASASFDETVDIAVRLGVDPRQADQLPRGTVDLPHGTGSVTRVIAFAEGGQAQEALDAGAVKAGADDLIEEISGGWLEFDAAVALPSLMRQIARLGRILGPRGLMPNPKSGTVGENIAEMVSAFQGGRISFRAYKEGVVHAPVGKASFEQDKLEENVRSFVNALTRARPAAVKGRFIQAVSVSSTMGPGVKVDASAFAAV